MSKVVITLGFTIDTQPTAYEPDVAFVSFPLMDFGWQTALAQKLQIRFGQGLNDYCNQLKEGTLSTEVLDSVVCTICEENKVDVSRVTGVAINIIHDEAEYSHFVAVFTLWRARHLDIVENYDDQMANKLAC